MLGRFVEMDSGPTDPIISKSRELIFSLADGSEQKFLLMGLKRFTKYYNYPKPIDLKRTIANIVAEENKYTL